MLNQGTSKHLRKTAIKLNTLQTQSKDLGKKRIYSLRKLPQQQQTIFNFGVNHNNVGLNLRQTQQIKQKNQHKQQPNINNSPRKFQIGRLSFFKQLSPIKQYQTKLKISAESWIVYDYIKDTYKRGWRPAQIGQFSGFTRFLILKTYIQLQKWNPQLKHFNLRVNTNYLKQQVEMRKQQKMPAHKRKGIILKQLIKRVLDNNIMINILDLLYGLFMTNYDDILQYAIVFMGHLCACYVNQTNPISQDSPCHAIQKISQACKNAQYFSQYLSQTLFPLLQMNSSTFQPKAYTLLTCGNDICRLYLSIQQTPIFKQIIKCTQLTCNIKYQIGFRYWQNRKLKLKLERIDFGEKYQFVAIWKNKKNYSVLSRNIELNILVILEDCKFGMAECDICNIQNWVKDLMKPIIDKRKTHYKLLPLLRLSNSPDKILHQLKQTKK